MKKKRKENSTRRKRIDEKKISHSGHFTCDGIPGSQFFWYVVNEKKRRMRDSPFFVLSILCLRHKLQKRFRNHGCDWLHCREDHHPWHSRYRRLHHGWTRWCWNCHVASRHSSSRSWTRSLAGAPLGKKETERQPKRGSCCCFSETNLALSMDGTCECVCVISVVDDGVERRSPLFFALCFVLK